MKYLNRFLLSAEKAPPKPTQPHSEGGFVSFDSANREHVSVSSASSTPLIDSTNLASEQLQRIEIFKGRVSCEELQHAFKSIRPELQLHWNENDRLELALSLALLDAGVDPAEVWEEATQIQSQEIKPR